MSGLSNIIKVMVLSFVFLSNAYGCEIHLSKKNTSLIINTTSQCVSFDTKSPISFAGTTPETLTVLSSKYNYPQEGTNCSDAIKFVNAWKVKWNSSRSDGARPVYDLNTNKNIGYISVGTECGTQVSGFKTYWREVNFNGVIGRSYCESK